MDAGIVTAAATFGVGSAFALGAPAGRPVYLIGKLAVLWLAEQVLVAALRLTWAAQRPAFERSASWWVEQHGARPVRRHRVTWSAEVRGGARLRAAATRAAARGLTGGGPLFAAEWVTA